MIDDILAVLILSILVSIFSDVAKAEGGHTQSNLGVGILIQVIYFIGIYLVFRWIAPFLMKISEKLLISSSEILMSLVICLGMAFLLI